MCFKGPKIRFHKESCIAITGAMMDPKLNGKTIEMYKPIKIKEGDLLVLGSATQGCRTYLAISGGIQTPEVLGSKSQFIGITSSERIKKRTVLPINFIPFDFNKGAALKLPKLKWNQHSLTVYKGPEFDQLPKTIQQQLLTSTFHIHSNNNRMGYQLKEKIEAKLPQIWTTPVLPGTVQCTPEGRIIILMRDAQVSGGYPRILQLSDPAIDCLAQKSTNDPIQFKINPLN
jgi:allophanate hydrolase subunit 2